jgi:threonine/homoserine/homoserine lactone efflux protein
MELQILLALTGFAFATTWTPGPNNMMLAASGATFGWRLTVPHALGVALGFPFMVFLIALGLGEVFQRSQVLQTGLTWGGFAVMLYLSWRIATAGAAKATSRTRPLRFHEAAAFQWVNPKAWMMAIGVSATYARGDDPITDAAIIAAAFVLAGLTSSQTWAAFGAGIGRALGTGTRLHAFNITMGLLLVACAFWMVLDS